MKDILEIVILCLSLWIIIPTLMIIWNGNDLTENIKTKRKENNYDRRICKIRNSKAAERKRV